MPTLNDLALRLLISAKDETGPGIKSAREGVASVAGQLQQVETLARRFLDIRLFAGWAGQTLTLADAYKTLQARLRIVSDTSNEYATAERELFAIAQRSRASLEATTTLYIKLETAIKQLGGSQAQALRTTETLNQAIALTSQGFEQDKAAVLQFSQALGSGVLRGDEFNSVMENAPGLAQALADGLGVPITKLRSMAEAGQLTADRLINALGQSAPQVAAQFAQLPPTVGGALTQVNNALLNFIGHSHAANSASARLAGFLQGLARNFDTVAGVAQTLATVYLVRVIQGWAQSAQAAIAAAAAAREKAAADAQAQTAAQGLLQAEVQLAGIRVKAAQAMVAEAQLQKALATGTEQQKLATDALTAATAKLHAAQAKATAANTAMAGALAGTAAKAGVLARGAALLGQAFNGLFAGWVAWDIGQTFGEWLRQFEAVRRAGSYLAETLVMIQTGAQALAGGMGFGERWAQIKQIHAEFEQLRAAETAGAQGASQAVSQAETEKAAAVRQAALKQQESFAKVQAATKDLTAQIDADAKTQTAAIQQGLAERLAAIEASDASDAAKDSLRVAAKLQATQAELTLQQQTAQLKLQLIEQEYAAELQQAQANAARLNEIETGKRQAKLSVYQGVAEFYAAEVAKLSGLYGQETAAYAAAKQSLLQAATNHQQAMLALDRQGMTARQKLDSEQAEYNQTLAKLRAELAKGDQASQAKINELMDRAKALQGEITQAAIAGADTQGKKSIAIYEAKKRENEIYGVQKQVLEANATAHEQNAKRVQTGLDAAKTELEKANAAVKAMTEQLSQQYLLKIGVDQASLGAAQSAIAELTKPETKIITIQTQNAGGPAAPVAGFAAGGGWARMAGLLSGYGGGDRRRALLEDGEFVVRKEAVRQLGVPVLQAVNRGLLPAPPLQLSFGGTVDAEADKRLRQRGIEQLQKLLLSYTYRNMNRYFAGDRLNNADKDLRAAILRMQTDLGLPADIVDQALQAVELLPKAYVARRHDPAVTNKAVREGVSYQAAIDLLGQTADKAPTMPALKMPALPAVEAARPAAPAKIVTVQFKAPGGGPAVEAALGSEADVGKLLDIIKQSGMRVGA